MFKDKFSIGLWIIDWASGRFVFAPLVLSDGPVEDSETLNGFGGSRPEDRS